MTSKLLADLASGAGKAALDGAYLFCVFYLLERWTGQSRSQYRSRNFRQDLTYWMYINSGFHRIVFNTLLFRILAPRLAFLNLGILSGLPDLLRYAAYFVVTDFLQYWVHRLQHGNRFMWALHTVHHSQERLTFASLARLHPIELVISDVVFLVSMTLLGAPPRVWVPIYWFWEIFNSIQHTEIPWRFGSIYKVFVSPAFHSFHHSIRPEHHNKNFGAMLSIWDFIFGTAVDEPERAREYGLTDVKMPTLVSTLIVPFRLMRRAYFGTESEANRTVPAASS